MQKRERASCFFLFAVALIGCGDSSSGGAPTTGGSAHDGATADSSSKPQDASAVNSEDGSTDATSPTPGVDATATDADTTASGKDGAVGAIVDAGVDSALAGWTLTWSDEFNGPDGSAVDPTKWAHDVNGNGWGNNELEYYTDGTQNAVVLGGNLVITATTAGASAYTCSYPSNGPCRYTSARLITQNKFSQQYGRFEARIQIPETQGLWPAFWMLGANIATAPWPACGEIDIMENMGKEPSVNHGSLHAPGFPGAGLTGSYTLAGAKLGDAFHTYAVEWEPSGIKFYVDDQLYETQTSSNTPGGGTWEYSDHAFFILLNVAVGGTFPGSPNTTSVFPQTMKVDWVRVYRQGP